MRRYMCNEIEYVQFRLCRRLLLLDELKKKPIKSKQPFCFLVKWMAQQQMAIFVAPTK